jgi:hypothetical protein
MEIGPDMNVMPYRWEGASDAKRKVGSGSNVTGGPDYNRDTAVCATVRFVQDGNSSDRCSGHKLGVMSGASGRFSDQLGQNAHRANEKWSDFVDLHRR